MNTGNFIIRILRTQNFRSMNTFLKTALRRTKWERKWSEAWRVVKKIQVMILNHMALKNILNQNMTVIRTKETCFLRIQINSLKSKYTIWNETWKRFNKRTKRFLKSLTKLLTKFELKVLSGKNKLKINIVWASNKKLITITISWMRLLERMKLGSQNYQKRWIT